MPLLFTHINHTFRKLHKLSLNEYVLADMIYMLSTSPEAKVKGWCYMGRVQMAEEMDLSKQSILNLIDKLIATGFVLRDEQTSFLKTTRKWNVNYFTKGKESLPYTNKEDTNSSLSDDKDINNDLFSSSGVKKPDPKKEKSSAKKEKKLLSDCPWLTIDFLKKKFKGTIYAKANIEYYYECALSWSDQHNKSTFDWVATIRNFILKDYKQGKMVTGQITPEATLKGMQDLINNFDDI